MSSRPFEVVLEALMAGGRPQPCARSACTTNISQAIAGSGLGGFVVPTRGGSVNGGWMHLYCAITQANAELAQMHRNVESALRALRGEAT